MSKQSPLSIIILSAGKGTRMKSALPKVMHPLAGRPMIGWLLETAESLRPDQIIVVTGPDMPDLEQAVQPHTTVIQKDRKGTGDAVKTALGALENNNGDVLILLGDMPLISTDTLEALIDSRQSDDKTGLSVLGVEFDEPPPFGRLVLNDDGTLARIVEDKDCTPEEKEITLCNTGAFCVDGQHIADWVNTIGNDNGQGEYYITDLPEIAAQGGYATYVTITRDEEEVYGVNSRADLALLEQIVQDALRFSAMDGGVSLIDPDTVYFAWDTAIGQDVTIEPNVVFGPGVEIGNNVTIHAFSHIEGAKIYEGAKIGPYARLRPGTVMAEDSKIGNFVEVKNSIIGQGSKVNHLTYIGDTNIGAGANVGAGTITCNYDGFDKHKTVIGDGVFVGSNSTLVAPVALADNAFIAAGSVITEDVPAGALGIARARGETITDWAAKYRESKTQNKKTA